MPGLFIAVGLVFSILVHEAAHLGAAKAFGMRATEFFAGFGPKLWSFTRGETEYGVKALMLGGYVKITGMHPGEEIDPELEDRTYRAAPFWKKSTVVLAGIVANLVFALVMIYGILLYTGVTELTSTINEVVATTDEGEPTAASLAGLEDNDVIVSYDGIEVEAWDPFRDYVRARPGVPIELGVDRSGELLSLVITPGEREIDGEVTGYMGIAPTLEAVSLGPVQAVGEAWSVFWEQTGATVTGLGQLLNPVNLLSLVGDIVDGDVPPPEQRPTTVVGIVAAGDEIQEDFGWVGLVGVLASLNIVVALFNLIPVLPFDGGHAAIALYQKATGRQANFDLLAPVAVGVIVLFMGIFLIGLWFDLFAPSPIG
jgi:membrane-associated protease RseP (regulator of RpoE activity)